MRSDNASARGAGGSSVLNLARIEAQIDAQGTKERLYWKFARELLFVVRPSYGGRFVYEAINPAFEALIGIASEEIREMAVSDCMGTEDARSVYQVLDACLAQGDETRLRHPLALGGVPRNIETVVAPMCDPLTGNITRLIGSHRVASEEPVEGALEMDRDDTGITARLASIQEDIQQRIASDLHDSTCQHLVAASLGLMRIRGCLSQSAEAEQIYDDINASIDRALREIRTFTYLLHPQNLAASGLRATVEHYAEGFAARTSLDVSARIVPSVDRLPYETQRSLLRVIQEALTNVFRHAKATAVDVAIEVAGKHFELSVTDNGRGIPALARAGYHSKTKSLGVGIPAMQARLQQMGGMLEIYSRKGGQSGTVLRAAFPRGHVARSVKGRRNHQLSRKQPMNEMVDR